MSEFIRKVTDHMQASGLDESALARAIGVSPSHINRWLAGKTRPHGHNLVKVLRAISGLTVEDVYGSPADVPAPISQPDIAPLLEDEEDEPTVTSVTAAEVARIRSFGVA